MGLDSVELVLRVEEEFEISITDEEAGKVRTVGQFYELILSKIQTTSDCVSSKAFYKIRTSLVEVLGISRNMIRPTTHLEEIIPYVNRKAVWHQLTQEIDLKMPRLHYSKTHKNLTLIVSVSLSAVLLLSFCALLDYLTKSNPAFLFSVFTHWILSACLWILLFTALNNAFLANAVFLRSELPTITVGNLVKVVLSLNPDFSA